jgi:hypothetical protein
MTCGLLALLACIAAGPTPKAYCRQRNEAVQGPVAAAQQLGLQLQGGVLYPKCGVLKHWQGLALLTGNRNPSGDSANPPFTMWG